MADLKEAGPADTGSGDLRVWYINLDSRADRCVTVPNAVQCRHLAHSQRIQFLHIRSSTCMQSLCKTVQHML
jgi:hypothetical protein